MNSEIINFGGPPLMETSPARCGCTTCVFVFNQGSTEKFNQFSSRFFQDMHCGGGINQHEIRD